MAKTVAKPKKAPAAKAQPTADQSERTKARAAKRAAAKALNEGIKDEDGANAAVGPIKGKLEAQPDDVKVAEPVAKPKKGKGGGVSADFGQRFDDLAAALAATSKEKKQPRQLRWALKALDAAKDAALRHIQHNV